jgi:signal transduction histidine kinase
MSPDASPASKTAIPTIEAGATSSYCQLGTQPNTCICALPVQDGQRIWEFRKIPLGGDRLGLPLIPDLQLLIATDITQQQQLAAELAAKNADLIGLNRLKDEFLACISHELRTPITAVMGLSTLLKDQTLGQLNERQARYAGLIHQSGRHLMSVVNDILDLTRMETGQINLSLEPVQIKMVCDRAIKQARATQPNSSSSEEPNVTLAIETGLDTLVADELRLRQMIIHLLANAIKFTQVDGKIGLRVNHWEGWIAFTVWDTGIGIPEQQQHLIFQKFQQLENPLTRLLLTKNSHLHRADALALW